MSVGAHSAALFMLSPKVKYCSSVNSRWGRLGEGIALAKPPPRTVVGLSLLGGLEGQRSSKRAFSAGTGGKADRTGGKEGFLGRRSLPKPHLTKVLNKKKIGM